MVTEKVAKAAGMSKKKRVQGILAWILGTILQAKGWVDPATAEIIKGAGVGWAAIGVVDAQDRKAKAVQP